MTARCGESEQIVPGKKASATIRLTVSFKVVLWKGFPIIYQLFPPLVSQSREESESRLSVTACPLLCNTGVSC